MSEAKKKAARLAIVGLLLAACCAFVLMMTLRSFWPPAQPTIALPPPSSPASVVEPPAPPTDEFAKYYALPPGVFVAGVDPGTVPPDVRLGFYNQQNPTQARAIPAGPDAMSIRWRNHTPSVYSMSFGNDNVLPTVLTNMLDIYPAEISGDASLLTFHGDIVWQLGATPEQYISSLEKLILKNGAPAVHLAIQNVQEKAIVFSGKWVYKRVDAARMSTSGSFSILIYSNLPYVRGAGGASGTFRQLAGAIEDRLSDQMKKPVIFEAQMAPVRLSWFFNREDDPDDKLILDHVQEQTGLNWSVQTRAVRCLVISGG